ncbi:MAG: carbamoyltransferase HypF [Deltaproteobacteria bacterium]
MEKYNEKAFEIKIIGLVQGIGFRPFIYRAAAINEICGFVANRGGEVIIHAEGKTEKLEAFIEYIKRNKPAGAVVYDMNILHTQFKNCTKFEIIKSISNREAFSVVQPDIAICDECLKDIKNTQSRYAYYPFTSCTECGPRLTIIENIPYDRENTAMKAFPMCPKCADEYRNPDDRRFHAQTICCPECGPGFEMFDNKRNKLEGNIFDNASRLIKQGFILAVKGIGGFHIICDAENDEAVLKLRQRKKRIAKPFAVMVKDIETAKKYCYINEQEKKLLLSKESPIVLLEQIRQSQLSGNLNAGLNRLGIMLPYSGIHELLFNDQITAIVATSGNRSGMPLITENDQAFEQLKDIVDYFLIHNREVINRCDDSVISNTQFIRRARGYVPVPLKLETSNDKSILACGADLKNTFTFIKKDIAYTSQHIGNLDLIETYEAYQKTIKQYEKIFNIKPEIVVCDKHPNYISTQFAEKSGMEIIKVQHHYAHIASVIAEHEIKGDVIGVAFDGTGYGDDGTIWGGEFFIASLKSYLRYAHLHQVWLPGGDIAAKEPWRMAGAYLQDSFGSEYVKLRIPVLEELKNRDWEILMKTGVNKIKTSSAGRMFDAVSAILGICYINTYEGQAAAEMEAIADNKQDGFYDFEIAENKETIVDYTKTILSIVRDIKAGRSISQIACIFHNTVAKSITDMCNRMKKETDLNKVVLSGGVFQNRLLLGETIKLLEGEGFDVYINNIVPCNDGGISFGQAAVGIARLSY